MAAIPITRIGFFGGSFNPPHIAHQIVCVAALASGEVDEIWLAPVAQHPFGKALAPFADRLRMCELAVEIFSAKVRVISIEAELSSSQGRTLETLQSLTNRYPSHQFRLVIGSDILAETSSWYQWQDVVALAPPLVIPRIPEISSTQARDLVAAGSNGDGKTLPLVPRAVMDYIAERGLYG